MIYLKCLNKTQARLFADDTNVTATEIKRTNQASKWM